MCVEIWELVPVEFLWVFGVWGTTWQSQTRVEREKHKIISATDTKLMASFMIVVVGLPCMSY